MSDKEQNDYPVLARHYRIALATGLTKEAAKIYANAQINNPTDISHLNIHKS